MRFERPRFIHSQLLFDWRNDPVTRRNSFNTEPVSWDEHTRWLEFKLWSGAYLYLIIENKPIGVLRFDQAENSNTCEMSITIAPEMRGRGLGSRAIREGARWFLENDGKRFRVIKARVKDDNVASMKAFTEAGFIWTQCLGNSNVYTFSRDDGARSLGNHDKVRNGLPLTEPSTRRNV